MSDVPLPFDVTPPEPRKSLDYLPASTRAKRQKPVYRRVEGSRHKCDDCLRYSAAYYPNDPVPLPAKWERRVRGEGAVWLCTSHKDQWQERDHG